VKLSLSSLGVIFRDLSVLWRSFTLPVWFTRCFNRTMTEWLTLNRSAVCLVGHITPYHSQEKIDSLKGSPDSYHSALQIRCEANGLSTGALADGPSIDVLTAHGFVLGDRVAYIESFSSLSCRTYHPLPFQSLAISLHLTVFDVPC
jgi:hypothetical protein